MAYLIDRNKLYNHIKTEINPYGKPFKGSAYELGVKLMEDILDMETVETAAVLRGEWEEIESSGWSRSGYNATPRIKCSVCGKEAFHYSNSYREHGGSVTEYRWEESNFCPNCGAKMNDKPISTITSKMIKRIVEEGFFSKEEIEKIFFGKEGE